MDLSAMSDAALAARSAKLYEQRQAISAEMGAISRILGDREEWRQLTRRASDFTEEQLAKMQTIKAEGIASSEAVGVPGSGGA